MPHVPNEELVLEGYRLRLARHIFIRHKPEGENEKGNINELKGGKEREIERERECVCAYVYVTGWFQQRAARYICADASIFTWRTIEARGRKIAPCIIVE